MSLPSGDVVRLAGSQRASNHRKNKMEAKKKTKMYQSVAVSPSGVIIINRTAAAETVIRSHVAPMPKRSPALKKRPAVKKSSTKKASVAAKKSTSKKEPKTTPAKKAPKAAMKTTPVKKVPKAAAKKVPQGAPATRKRKTLNKNPTAKKTKR